MSTRRKEETGVLNERDFAQLARFVRNYSGIVIDESRRTMLEFRLQKRMHACGISDVEQYCSILTEHSSIEADDERTRFIDAITVNKTDFFREISHFDFLENTVLPQLSQRENRLIKIWSAACATGAEPYSIAMVLYDFCRSNPGMDFFVLGTDISQTMIERASRGCFAHTMLDQIPLPLRRRHLMKPKDDGRREFRITPHLRQKIAFARMNLMAEQYPVSTDYDVIFCRNVMIYFDKPTAAAVLTRLARHLRTGGYLLIGHSETTTGIDVPLVTYKNAILRKESP